MERVFVIRPFGTKTDAEGREIDFERVHREHAHLRAEEKAEENPLHLVVFAGHRVDEPGRTPPRFPEPRGGRRTAHWRAGPRGRNVAAGGCIHPHPQEVRMKQVTLPHVPEVLGPAFEAGDPQSGDKAQERDNVERIGQMFHAIARGRFDELRHMLAYDVAYEIAAPPHVPWVRRALGPEEVSDAIASNFRSVRDQRSTPLALVSQGDTVMVMGHETGSFVASGDAYEVMLSQQYTFRDGRLAVFRSVVSDVDGPPSGSR